MLFSSLRRAALFAAAAISLPFAQVAAQDGQSTFVSDNQDLVFGVTVPSDSENEWYLTMRVAKSRSWGAVGVGSNQMAGALFLIVYKSYNGTSVTFSPRLSYNNYEPEYYDDLKHGVLGENISVTNDYYQVTARLDDRTWPGKGTSGGWFSSGNSKAIYALGPKYPLYSDDLNADLRFHNEYGSLEIDLNVSKGNANPPVIPQNPTTKGVNVISTTKNRVDNRSTLHATFMVLGVLVLLPLGVVFLRVVKWARWHGVTQLCAVLVILAAAGLGVADSFYYARSWHFNSPHQIIGLVTVGLFIAQLTLGIFHHMERKDLMSPTKWSNIHLWLGRVALLLGWVNCFIGFNFAMNRQTGFIIALVIIAILFAALFFMFYKSRQRRKAAVYGANQAQTFGQEPWRRAPEPNAARGEYDPGNNDFNSEVNLQSASPWQSGEQATNRSYVDEPEVGGVATPKATPKVPEP